MSRDYKGRANPGPKKKQQKQSSGGIWFAAGLVAGLFIAGLVWLKLASTLCEEAGPQTAAPKAPVIQKESSAPKKAEEKSLPPKPRFDFYTILPEMEVLVPEPEEDESPAPVVAAGTPVTGSAYMLQMGSFRKHGDADRFKANLALLGVEAKIQKVNNEQGVFHRVLSGPYRNRKEINEVRARLQQNKINSLLIKLKN
ncbi:SPOR domain-containing protein [Pseudomonadota bacterium]